MLYVLAKSLEAEKQRQESGFERVRFQVLCAEFEQLHLPLLKPGTRVGYVGHMAAIKARFGTATSTRSAEIAAYVLPPPGHQGLVLRHILMSQHR